MDFHKHIMVIGHITLNNLRCSNIHLGGQDARVYIVYIVYIVCIVYIVYIVYIVNSIDSLYIT